MRPLRQGQDGNHYASPRSAAKARSSPVTDRADDIPVAALVATSDIIAFPDATAIDHAHQRIAMIGDAKPIADVRAVSIDRQRLSLQCMNDHQGSSL
jgi:hypothetical protein